MCHQSVGLIQAAVEGEGITTVGVSVSEEITSKVGPPRTLQVPYGFGYTLGEPEDAELQHAVIASALELLQVSGPPPVSARFEPLS